MRIPLATPLKTRTGDTSKDARLKNAYAEVRGEQSVVRHRPSSRGGLSVGTGTAQGGIGLNINGTDTFIGFWGDTLTSYTGSGTSWDAGTYYSIGDHVSYEWVDYWAVTDHSGSQPPSADWSTSYVPAVPFNPTEWSAATTISASAWEEIAYGGGIYIVVANNLATSVAKSSDATNWSSQSITSGYYRCIAYGAGVFVALSYSDSRYSADGSTWNTSAMPASLQNFEPIECVFNGVFVASGGNTGGIGCAYSLDGVTWSPATTWPLSATGSFDVFGGASGEFFASTWAGGAATNSTILKSTNSGVDWAAINLPATRKWYRGAYGNGIYIVTSAGTNIYAYSTDGSSFTEKTLPVSLPSNGSGYAITYGNGFFVLVYGSTSYVSSNGIDWTSIAIGASATWADIVYSNKKFVAIASSSTTVRILT